jgi:hypothetical protein
MDKDKKKSKKDEKKKRKKEDKKKRKKKSLDVEGSNDDGETSGTGEAAAAAAAAIPIKLSASITPNSNTASSATTAGFSWGAAFAAADSIRPNDDELDDDFLQRAAKSDADAKASASTYTSLEKESIKSISQLASSHNVSEKNVAGRKRKLSESRSSDDDSIDDDAKSNDSNYDKNSNDDDDESVLEGRTATIPGDDKSIITMVLVDKHGSVYSSGERKSDGKRLQIGQLVGNDIKFDTKAIEEMKRIESGGDTSAAQSFPYETNEDDHCETPFQAYADIEPILDALCKSMGKSKSELKIYDPYFCNGSVVKHLSSLGYTNVYNKKEDCYAVWEARKEPDFDVSITNPPYSSDHIDKLMKYITSTAFGSKPWLLLMPNWVHKKEYYEHSTTKNQINPIYPFYIVPKKRYVYVPPPDFREKKASDVHKKSSPFVSMWYVWGGTKKNDTLIRAFQQSNIVNSCDFARSKSALRDLRRNGGGGGNKSSKNKKKKKSK